MDGCSDCMQQECDLDVHKFFPHTAGAKGRQREQVLADCKIRKNAVEKISSYKWSTNWNRCDKTGIFGVQRTVSGIEAKQ